MSETRQHYFLVSGEVSFVTDKKQVGTARQNAFLATPESRIPVPMLGRAQQALQVNFHQKLLQAGQKQLPTIVDVTLISISPLGEFTEEEWNPKKPEEKQ